MTSSTDTRNTRQRDIILEEICKVCTHPTAKDVYGMVKKRMPSIGLATVYRGLDRLEKEGKILKLKSKGKEARYDGNAGGHCHLICKDCGCIDDIFDTFIAFSTNTHLSYYMGIVDHVKWFALK